MKKIITTFMMMALMMVAIPMFAGSAEAQTRYRTRRAYTTTTYNRPSFYQRHRNLINVGLGTAAGALLGGLIGGKKGALIGTAAGAGGAALYSYKLKPKRPVYYYR